MRHGVSRADVLVVVACSAVVGCLGVSMTLADPSGRGERLSESLANLRAIGSAMGQYRADNPGYTPFEGTTSARRPVPNRSIQGLCSWQFGGKNASAFWFGATSGLFDVEAADRPLNPSLYPQYTFQAPPPPGRLPVNDPNRVAQQARVFRDPADLNGRNRTWPNPNNPPISSYDDVGTSYQFNFAWLDQFRGPFDQNVHSATARMATEQGVDPDRFVYLLDDIGTIVTNVFATNTRIQGNHGGDNTSVVLFADGHSAFITLLAGITRDRRVTAEYSVWFEDIGRPSGLERKAIPGASR